MCKDGNVLLDPERRLPEGYVGLDQTLFGAVTVDSELAAGEVIQEKRLPFSVGTYTNVK